MTRIYYTRVEGGVFYRLDYLNIEPAINAPAEVMSIVGKIHSLVTTSGKRWDEIDKWNEEKFRISEEDMALINHEAGEEPENYRKQYA